MKLNILKQLYLEQGRNAEVSDMHSTFDFGAPAAGEATDWVPEPPPGSCCSTLILKGLKDSTGREK